MVSFLVCVAILILGYVFYGKYVEKVFKPDDRMTPAYRNTDGVDFIPIRTWRAYLIQLLNIAGTGPIFGALSGALFGPIVYLWIVFGCIFAGAVHDYLCGMISEREDGGSVSEIVGEYLGVEMKYFMRIFSIILLIMCGVVFTEGPAELLALLTPAHLDAHFWLIIVMIYYLVATFLPIDKIIGKIYPIFGICLITMAVGVGAVLCFNPNFTMPELYDNFKNMHAEGLSPWPFMLITVACGAISGFHATQSPIVSRCIKDEKVGRKVFYGAMITEGLIALVWAAAGVTCYESSKDLLMAGAGSSVVVYDVCKRTMGEFGGVIAMLGVIACPISSGDTSFRSARLVISDWLKIDQKDIFKRMLISILLLGVAAIVLNIDYNVVWRYFSFSNQSLATIVLWAETVYLYQNKRNYYITLVPAVFMTSVVSTYFILAKECLGHFGIPYNIGMIAGILIAFCTLMIFVNYKRKFDSEIINNI